MLIFLTYMHVYTCRAGTNCDVLVLTKSDLDNALQYYPHIADHIQEVANNRANLIMKRSQIAKMAAAEGMFNKREHTHSEMGMF